jgi:hypothetical protein
MLGTVPASAMTTVTIAPLARLAPGGYIVARLEVTCDAGREVLEAHLTISQDDQRVTGTAGIAGIRCDGRPHTVKVRVTPLDGAFHEGGAVASAFILRLDPSAGTTEQGQDSSTINVKGSGGN